MNNEFLYLKREDVINLCRDIDTVAVMREVFALHASGETVLPDEAYLGWHNEQGESVRSLNMPAYVGGTLNSAGTKIINGNIHNSARGLPRANGLTMIFDRLTGNIQCVMEAAYLSSLRTASVSALAVEVLQGQSSGIMAVIGAGVLARAHIELFVRRFPQLHTIAIFDLDQERVDALYTNVASLLESHQVRWQPVATAEAAIRGAQLVVPVTTTTTGYIPFAWLHPGAILLHVSLDDVLPEVVLQADKVVVDDWNLVKNDSRRLLGRMYREGKICGPDEQKTPGRRCIEAQLGDIVRGSRPGRRREQDIILVNPFGLAIEDVALATHVYRLACQRNMGVVVPY